MAFNIAALGAGLGQFAQQYQQQQESAMRQRVVQQQLEQLQREQAAKSLLTQAFGQGGMPGFGGGQGIQPLPSSGGMMPPAPQQQPPTPQLTQPPAPPVAAPPPGPRTLTEDQQDAMETAPAQMTPDQTDQLYRAAGASQSRAGVPLEPAPAPPPSAATRPPSAMAAAAPGPDATPAPDPGIQTHDEMTSALSLFQRTDPGAWVKRIKEARPNAPDDVVWDAVERLNKMASGNIREQLAAASMIKFLKGEEGKNQRFAQAEQRRGGQLEVAQGNLAERQKTQQRLSSQFQERVSQFNARLAQAKANTNATDKRTALNALLRDIEKQLYPGFGATQPTDEEKAALMQQRSEIVNTLRQSSGMQPLAPAAPAPAQ